MVACPAIAIVNPGHEDDEAALVHVPEGKGCGQSLIILKEQISAVGGVVALMSSLMFLLVLSILGVFVTVVVVIAVSLISIRFRVLARRQEPR